VEQGIIKAVQDVFPHIPHQIIFILLLRDIGPTGGIPQRYERIKGTQGNYDHV